MAELYFKVKSDWEEVVKLRTEIMRLENQLNQFNGKAPLEVLDKMCSELTNAKTRLTELVEAAAVEGAKLDGAFKKSITIDVSTPMGQLKAFDDELQKMSSNLNAYFDTLKGKLVDMVSVLGDGKTIADNIKVNEENLAKIDELNRLNAELREQIKQIQQELDRQQAAWQQVQNTISGNKQAIDGLTQSQHQQAQASAESVARMNAAIDEETRKNEAAKKSWEDKKAEIESLQAELQKYQAAYDRVMQLKPEDGRLKRWWRETQFASAANNGEVDDATIQHVVGLNSKIEELKQRIKDAQKEEKALSDQFASSSRRVDELRDSVDSTLSPLRQMQQAEDAASKALRLDSARAMLRGITQEMDEAIDKMRTLEGDAERYRDYISKLENGDTSVLNNGQDAATELANARAELEKCEAELENQKKEYNDLAKYQEQYKQQIVDASGHQMRMRTQIMQTREEMMKMIAEGKAGTPEFQQLSEKAGEMRKQMALANATMEYFANPSRHLEGLKSALQGVAGSASLVTGIMGVFNTNSEKMAAIQTKIQSYLGIIVGLETAYATVKKTSNAMLLISEVQTLALAKAKTYETIATEAGTIATMKAAAAQAFFNTVAKMNPYLLLVSGIGLLCGAIWGLTKVLKSESEEEKRLQKEREARIKEAREAHERWANDVASSAGKQIASYENLRRKWKELGNDMTAKKKFIDDNKDAFHDLGWAVNNVADAENLFTKNTQAVINAMLARAKAAAYQTAIADEYTKSIKKRDQIDNTVAGGGYRRVYKEGDRITSDQIQALNQQYGVNLSATSLDPRTQIKGVAFSTDSKLTAASAAYLTSLEAKDATKRWKDNVEALNKETEERVGYLTKGLEQAVKMQEQAVKAVGVQEWQGGNAGSGSRTKGNSPDEILKRQIEQEQEAERTRIQNQLLQQQAVIDQMDEGAEKELAQMRLNHKKRMTELDNEEQEILNKKIEAASNDKKGNPIKGFYTSGQYRNVQLTDEDMLGVNSKRMSEMVSMFDAIAKSSANTDDRMIALRQAYSDFVSDVEDSSGNKLVSDDAFANIEAQFKRVEAGIRREEVTAMREYLREYGSYEQQRLAITQEYEERIKRAKTEGERLKLQKERDKTLSSQSFESISMGIDWSALLNGVGNLSQEMLKPMLEQLQAYTKTDQFNQADIQEREKVVELINELKKYVGTDQNATWQQLSTAITKFTDAVAKYREADAQEKLALQNLANARGKLERGEISQDDFDRIEREARELGARTVEAKDEMQQLGRTLNETSDEVKGYVSPLTTALQKMSAWQGVEGFSGLQNGVAQFDQLKGTLDSILPNMGDGMAKTIGSSLSSALGSGMSALGDGLSSVMSSGIGSIIGIVAQIPRMILQLADAIKNMVTGILDAITELLKFEWLSDLVNSILEAIGNLVDAIFDLPEHLFNAISSIVVDGVGGLVDGVLGRVGNVLSFGLLSSGGPSDWFTNSNAEEVAETTERLTEENEKLRNSIDGLCEEIKSDGGSKSIKSAQEALEANRQYIENQREILDAQQGYHSAHHSNAYYWDLGREHQNQVNALLAEYAKRNNKTASRVNSDWGTFAALSPEEMDYIRNHNLELWKQLEDIGKYDKSEFFEAFADLAGSEKEILDSLNEALTQTSFDSLKNNFISNLMDMERSAEDFSEDFTNMMMQAVLNARISDLMDKEIQDFYDEWAKLSKDASGNGYELTKTELDTLSKMWDDIINHGMQIRDEVAAVTGYDQTNAAKQEADKKGFAGMSQDLGEELNGRFTAVQIAGENVSAQMNVAVPILTGIGVSASRTADMVEGIGRVADDMLTNIVECYSELNMIRTTTDEMLPIMKENKKTLEKIEKNTKNI